METAGDVAAVVVCVAYIADCTLASDALIAGHGPVSTTCSMHHFMRCARVDSGGVALVETDAL